MTPALTALILGCCLLSSAAFGQNGRLRTHFDLEQCWVFGALYFGCLGTLLPLAVPSLGTVGTVLRLGPVAVASLLLLLRTIRQGSRLSAAGGMMLALFAGLFAFGLANGEPLMTLASFIVFLPMIVSPVSRYSGASLRRGALTAVGLFGVTILLSALVFHQEVLGACRGDKCSLWGEALGPLGTGNALGVCLASVSLVALALMTSFWRWVGCALGGVMLVDLTSSRSALISWAAGALIVGIYSVGSWRRRTRSSPVDRLPRSQNILRGEGITKPRHMLGLLVFGMSLTVLVLPFLDLPSQSFTGRGNLWNYGADELFPRSWLFGYGSSFWVRQSLTSDLQANYSTHNAALEMLISGGVWGLSCLVLAVILTLRGVKDERTRGLTLAFLGTWIATGLTEVASLPGRIYLLPGLLVFVFLYGHSQSTVERVVVEDGPGRQLRSRGVERATPDHAPSPIVNAREIPVETPPRESEAN
ncbi:O-antigen ligase family protein [Curtobacterium sp. RRHDQ10]|uniref:O-antigen ligase family protein n=1 Tax=Curtobacterium phyllosphaerae TaxID=3413379 RepID=UPI003BF10A13